ncbi:MAG TPA: ribbon-helix-helix protein, CopG family [Longimicrobium sp.]|nr:ribbon-helix-helix protein, CopG family [Longimicrobium sp.]
MRTTLSLPDELFSAADALAERLGVSRSELYATAVAEFIAKHNVNEVTARLDQVYAHESSTLDPSLERAQRRSLARDAW